MVVSVDVLPMTARNPRVMITLGIKTYEETSMVAATNGQTHASHVSGLVEQVWASPAYGNLVRRAKEWGSDNPIPDDNLIDFVKSLPLDQRQKLKEWLNGEELGEDSIPKT